MKNKWTVIRIDEGYWDYAILKNCGRIEWTEDEEDATMFTTEEMAKKVVKNINGLDKIMKELEPIKFYPWHYTHAKYGE